MSEPVTNTDIEDVLSSIRRLVSEDGRRAPRKPDVDAPQQVSPAPAVPDRLVLTPAQRVVDDRDINSSDMTDDLDTGSDRALAGPTAVQEHDTTDRSEPLPPLTLEPVAHAVALDDIDTRADADTQSWPGTDNADPAADDADDISAWDAEASQPSEPMGDEDRLDNDTADEFEPLASEMPTPSEVQPDDETSTPHQPADHAARTGLEAKIAELEALIGRSDDEWEPDDAGQGDYAGDPTNTLEWEDADGSALAGPDPAPEPGPEEAAEQTDHDEPTLQADDAASEPADAPEHSAQDTSDDWQVAETSEIPVDQAAPSVDDAGPPLSEDETSVIEEAVLRDMLTDIVREELQGVLGERITRNVRKLVRREIHRALSSREFD